VNATTHAAAAAVMRRALSLRLFRMRFLFLFLALLLVMLVSPFLDDSLLHRSFMVVLFGLVLLTAILIAGGRHHHRIVALMLGIPWLALSLFGLLVDAQAMVIYANLLASLFCLYVIFIVLSHLIDAETVDLNILLGAASVYLLLALTWTASYLIIIQLDPAAFSLVHGESRPYFHQFLYFSLTTLTTVGYGDITPVHPFAQIWSTMEAVFGTLYMALLVARLVGLYQSQKAQGE
jgi:hypothetical protein